MIEFSKTSITENNEYFNLYLNNLNSKYDESVEEFILDSQIYSIYNNKDHIGYFGLYNNKLLTQFFISAPEYHSSQKVFTDILGQFDLKNAFVPAFDERFLCHCLDINKKVTIYSYIFNDNGKKVKPAKYPSDFLTKATMEDVDEIISITKNFVKYHEERIKRGQLYILRESGQFLGMGVKIENTIMKGYSSIGMFTSPMHRQKGVGSSIILHLKDMCYQENSIPIAGCLYENINSRKTLESTGFAIKSSFLNFEF